MKILAVDTSSAVATCAITDGNKLVAERILNNKLTHSQTIMPMIEDAFRECEMSISDIDLFAVSNGPGSFTGLRIGVSSVKALAHSQNKPCAAVSTLEAMAYNLMYSQYLVCPIMDARRGEVYAAVYRFSDGAVNTVIADTALPVSELCEKLEKLKEKVIFLGDGVPPHREYIENSLGDSAIFAPAHLNAQRASSLAYAAQNKEYIHYSALTPVYLRKSQAEREMEERKGNNDSNRK